MSLQKEKFHSQLALLYTERVLALLSQPSSTAQALTQARSKLQRLLKESTLYRVQMLLGEFTWISC